jgi:cell division protein FtsZ
MVEERVAVEPAASVTNSPAAAPDPGPEPAGDTAFARGASDTGSGDRVDDEAEPVAAAAVPARHRADPGAAARMFDAATTRRRSVVFEEDDDLDVPDFLK